jgi:hypothetical protein
MYSISGEEAVLMKKIAVMVLAVMLVACGTALAEDGFKAFVGYSIGGQSNQIKNYEMGGDAKADVKGLQHGPSVELRYEGTFFARVMYNHYFSSGAKITNPDGEKQDINSGNNWDVEGNVGFRLYHGGGFGVTPYVGFGYRSLTYKFQEPSEPEAKFEYNTPYAVAGMFLKYDAPRWSAGVDVAGLLPFSGQYKARQSGSGTAEISANVGWGVRVQVPITYTIVPRKSGGVGILAFVTPFYEHIDTMKSELTYGDFDGDGAFSYTKIKYELNDYGVKVGVGFSF